MKFWSIHIYFLCLCLFAFNFSSAQSQSPSGLLCEFLKSNELATITDSRPEFAWIIESDFNDEVQLAYHILVSDDLADINENIGNQWDSGWINSSNSINAEYNGVPLESEKSYWWKVRVRLDKGGETVFSSPAQFNTGNLNAAYQTSRYQIAIEEVKPKEIITLSDGHYFIDFGTAAFGTIGFEVNNPDNGIVNIHIGEKRYGNQVDRNPGGTIRYQSSEVEISSEITDYQANLTWNPLYNGWIAVPSNRFEVAPFRYAEIIGDVAINSESIYQKTLTYPFEWSASSFSSSDQTLNDVWELCKYSMKATSFLGVYVDGDRERIPYEADAYIQQLSHYVVDRGSYSIARYSHEHLMDNPTWPTEWKQHSVLMAWADYLYTGDSESLQKAFDQLKAEKTLEHLVRSDGLIEKDPQGDLVDWPPSERDDFEFGRVNSVVNAFYYHCLNIMSNMAMALNLQSEADRYASQAEEVYSIFNQVFWDSENSKYKDGEEKAHTSFHANFWALAFGLVPDERISQVVEYIKSRGMACSVYGAQYLLEALYSAGEDEYALELMTSHNKRSWQNMINVGSTITLEAWDIDFKDNLDWNHAWGAAPGNIIVRHMFGIQPLEPGFKKIQIRPQLGGLVEANVKTPTMYGPISVEITQDEERMDLTVSIPANTNADIYVPKKGIEGTIVFVDDIATEAIESQEFLLLKDVGSGTKHIERSNRIEPILTSIPSPSDDFIIWPNPTFDVLNMRFNDVLVDRSMSIFTLDGRIIHNSKLSNTSSQLDISSYKPGLYIISIIEGDFKMVKTFIKQ